MELQKKILQIMNAFVSRGTDNNNKCLGAYYALGALTFVSLNAKESMFWLWEEFRQRTLQV